MLNNKKLKNNNIVIMNFTGVYENQEFYQDLGAVWLELGDIQGTNCYSYEEAEAAIKEMRKHLAAYTKGLKNATNLRNEIFKVCTKEDVLTLLNQYMKENYG